MKKQFKDLFNSFDHDWEELDKTMEEEDDIEKEHDSE